MKTTSFFTILAVAGMFAACSNDKEETISSEARGISFGVQGGMPETKTTTTTKDKIDAFVVYGTDDATKGTGNTLLFNGVTVARTIIAGNAESFKYSPLKFYGEGAAVSVWFAFSPVHSYMNTISNWTENGFYDQGLSFTYTVPKKDPSGKTMQDDFLVASTKKMPTPTTINLEFKHALARMFVYASNSTEEAITIKGVKLLNLYSKGRFVLYATGDWDWAADKTSATNYEYLLPETGIAVPVDRLTPRLLINAMDQGMMIIPQETSNLFGVEIEYVLGGVTRTKKQTLVDRFFIDAGIQYGISIDISGNDIKFTIDVEDWRGGIDSNNDEIPVIGIN